MEISPAPEFKKALMAKITAREFKERTGVHCSDLIYCLNKQALRRRCPKPVSDSDLLLFSQGWATQRWLTGQDVDKPEKCVDGITVTLDSVGGDVDPTRGEVPWELKATYTSSEKDPLENHAWIHQIMAQCYVSGTVEAYLTRFEIMGNWKSIFPRKAEAEALGITVAQFKDLPANGRPTLSAWVLSFTPRELGENWGWLIGRSIQFKQIVESGELLPKIQAIPSGQEYECERCEYRGKECTV